MDNVRVRRGGGWILSVAIVGVTTAALASCSSSEGAKTSMFDAMVDSPPASDTSIAINGSDAGMVSCVPKTCADLGYDCGANGDGCGNAIDCGACALPTYCGGGGYSKCGGNYLDAPDGAALCTPTTCADKGYTCGVAGDGCGNQLQCGSCSFPEFCGGAGFDQCGGSSVLAPDGGLPCTPATCASLGYDCGSAADGCGNLLLCGSCTSPEVCGGGGFDVCGTGGDAGFQPGAALCTPENCLKQGFNCGTAGDGCGGTLSCGACDSPQFCGGGGFNKCGGDLLPSGSSSACVAETCNSQGFSCGKAGDGCGNPLDCGPCSAPDYCGGGGPFQCGYSPSDAGFTCVPATCASLGYNCGFAADGCGQVMECGGTCPSGTACGGGGQRNVCGSPVACTGLCLDQMPCSGGATTTLVGKVVASTPSTYLPAGVAYGDPVPNVLVYVPNGTVQPFVPRSMESAAQQCSACGADVTGQPLVQTTTAYDGTFTLANVPVASGVPLVIQLGRWRRQFTVSVASSCAANTVNDPSMPPGILMMPSKQSEGDIPLTGISTGQLDAMECVLLKMGIDASEFTTNASSPSGRVHLYLGNGAGSSASPTTPAESALMGNAGTFNQYDQLIFPCWGVDPTSFGSTNAKSPTELANLVAYANAGGHFFATHYSYSWLYDNPPFNMTAHWDVNADQDITSTTGVVSSTVPPVPVSNPGVFVEWLNGIQALENPSGTTTPPNPAEVSISAARHDVDSVLGSSVAWITGSDPTPSGSSPSEMLLHYTFDTPVNAANQCGHAIFSDFHVNNQANTAQYSFPADATGECGTAPMTAQEKILEYMIWDLASCVVEPPQPTCTPLSCGQQNLDCGAAGDGCGGQISGGCGVCTAPETCGGGGVFGKCGLLPGPCAPLTCKQQNLGCGPAGDGCGNPLDCGDCPAGQTCGGAGTNGQCGAPPSTSGCVPSSCTAQGIECGATGDGCGGALQCGTCPPPQICGGGGKPGKCGMGHCTPQTCVELGINCGPAGDGCGNELQCGTCPIPEICGGGGQPGRCARPAQ